MSALGEENALTDDEESILVRSAKSVNFDADSSSRSFHGSAKRRASSVVAVATAERMNIRESLSGRSLIGDTHLTDRFFESPRHPILNSTQYGSLLGGSDAMDGKHHVDKESSCCDKHWADTLMSQLMPVLIASVLNFMVGIPFGAAYFPVGWSSTPTSGAEDDDVHGAFPLPGKEALGIRMYLFSTAVAQGIFTYVSKFDDCIGLQMVENVPFCIELAHIVISEQGYGIDALSTLFFLFGISSVIVGFVFYLLGKLELGRIVYLFPRHVLVGCIGGIGAFIVVTAIEVTTDSTFSFTLKEVQDIYNNFNMIGVVLLYELILRVLLHFNKDGDGKHKYPLLAPAFYLAITPTFYMALWILGISKDDAAEYFFPSLDSCNTAPSCDNNGSVLDDIFNESLFDMWRVLQFSTISWTAVTKAIPTVISLVAFSLIHVPINIPAFAISMDTEPDMNAELIAHGYSNAFAGLFAGLQNYMCYCNSVIYAKAGGKGRASSLAVVGITILLFIFGPTIASFVPRCMAGCLLLHVGIDLLLEGVYDSYGNYDYLEYSGIWLITVVMVLFGMSAALIAGAAAALSTYAVQSATYQYPIRGIMSAETLRSSAWNRDLEADAILQSRKTGRKRILIVQLQGHLFFGNVALVTDDIKAALKERSGTDIEPLIVILDFTLVQGMDSSAAQSIARLKGAMHRQFQINLAVWVSGCADGFPCEYNLTGELSEQQGGAAAAAAANGAHPEKIARALDANGTEDERPTGLFQKPRMSGMMLECDLSLKSAVLSATIPSNHVCESLDEALIFAEDVLIALEDPTLLDDDNNDVTGKNSHRSTSMNSMDLDEEKEHALRYLANLCPGSSRDDLEKLFGFFERERHSKDDDVWRQGSKSDSAKLLLSGLLVAVLENEGRLEETIVPGSMLGELGLVNMTDRLTTVRCTSEHAVLYSMNRSNWDSLVQEDPRLARFIDMIVVRYLEHRVQHVSNRIFETRCLPV